MAAAKTGLRGILSYFTRHPTAANLILVLLFAVGLWAAPQMRAQFFPDVVIERINVSVAWEGAGPEDVDAAIVQLLEPALLGVEGVESSQASSREGFARISLEFEPDWDMRRAVGDVEAATNSITNLPDGAEDPKVTLYTWSDRVTDVVITGPVGVDQLARFSDEFVTRLFQAGITRTTIRGLAAPSTIIEVRSINLIKYDVEMSAIAAAIRGEAEVSPAGNVEGANTRVRAGIAKRSSAELAAVVIRSNPDGSTLTVGDVGAVLIEGSDRQRAYFVGDNPAISIRVDRSDQGDAIGMQATVQRVAEEMEQGLPQGVSIDLVRTRAEAITGRLNILLDNGLLGLGLVLALLFLFLNARTAFWVAAGIPVAMAAAVAMMFLLGVTLNMVSLFALIITLGIVVDDAIVVGEHADFRARSLGEPPVEAAENAARRMAAPVFSATITTVIAFFSLVIIGGRFGELIFDIPITVCLVLLASLLECFVILPHHMAHSLVHSAKQHWYDWPSRQFNRGFNWVRERLFRSFIAGVLTARYPVLAGVVLLLASQAALFIRGDVQWRFFNAPERGSISGNFSMLPGAERTDTIEMMRELQRATNEVAQRYEDEHGTNPLDYVMAEIGGNTGRALSGADTKDPDQLGAIAIELIDADLRPYSSFKFLADVQEAVRDHPKLEELSFRGWRSGPGGDALEVQLYGAEARVLKEAAEAIKTELSAFSEVSALEDTLAYDKEEMVLDLTARGQALGFTIDGIGRILRDRLNGIEAATYPVGPRSATIRVELPENELTADFLDRTLMRAPSGAYVPLTDIVKVEQQAGFSTVQRENGLRVVSVYGDISEDDPARANEIMRLLKTEILPQVESDYGVASKFWGQAEEERQFLSDATLGFMLCLLGIYLVLAWVFSSFTRPIVVMAVIPFGLIGVIYGHAAWDVPLSMFSVVGLIGLTGIIINDSIVLVTTVDEYAAKRGLKPAIIDAAADRLRPVVLTTLTTVLGLTPLMFESSEQAQFLRPTVITLVYGLGFGVVLVLMVVPAILGIQQDIGRQVRAFWRVIRARRRAKGAGVAISVALTLGLTLFISTIGVTAITGTLLGTVDFGIGAAVAVFTFGMAVTVLITYLVAIAHYYRQS